MIFDYYTIREISKYCNNNLKGAVLSDIFSQDKDKIVFSFEIYSSGNISIDYSCSIEFPYLRIVNEYKKTKKNVASLFPEMLGNEFEQASLYDDDRVLSLKFSGEYIILFSFIPSRYNVLLIKNGIIITSFKNSNQLSEIEIKDFFRLKTANIKKELKTYKDYLKKHNPKLNNIYINEICYRCQVSENSSICEENIELLKIETEKINSELLNPVFLKYTYNDKSFHSLLELKSISSEMEKFDSIITLLNSVIAENLRIINTSKKKNSILENRRKKIGILKKKIENIDKNIEQNTNSQIYREYGDIIYSNLLNIKKGESEFIYEDGKEIKIIKLKKEFNPQQNAEYYYKKYKRQKNSIEGLLRKKELLRQLYEKELNEINDIIENNNLKKIFKMHKEEFNGKEEIEKKYFRKFILNESYQVWVGKDSYSNDLLTMRYSSPHDYWFHVRGATGSHTVLKINNKTIKPDKEIIRIAASIAAYYSKARNASNVNVAYCERKYVKKIKGLKQGSVIMEREKIVNVKPGIPDIEEQRLNQ